MKPFLNVEKDRREYHKNVNLNTVHRSSLLVPKIQKNKTCISFLNHFLLKRSYKNVVLKITGYFPNGESGDSVSYVIDKPKVYIFYLEELGDLYSCYQVEFFCAQNLFIPFPAVMVNHISEQSINSVHSYNRILNDTREESNVNQIHLREASIDFSSSDKYNTFFILQSGLIDLDGFLDLTLEPRHSNNEKISKNIAVSMKKMSIKKLNLNEIFTKELFGRDIKPSEYTLRILQPKQTMFYGRLLAGIENIDTGSISANHSYYDNSEFEEYFKSNNSFRTFPFFANSKNKLRIYPIMSKGKGSFLIFINYVERNKIKTLLLDEFKFDNTKTLLSIDIDKLLTKFDHKLDNIQTFSVVYSAMSNYKVPTRVNMQLIYGSKIEKKLDSSVNISLHNKDIFVQEGKTSYSWIQMVNSNEYLSQVGMCFSNYPLNDNFDNSNHMIEIQIYDSKGCILKKEILLRFLEVFKLREHEIDSKDLFIWIVAKSKTPNLSIYSFQTNKNSHFSSGEHSF